jgi:hypothetical protein
MTLGPALEVAADIKHGDYGGAAKTTGWVGLGVAVGSKLGVWMLPVGFVITAATPSQLDPADEARWQKWQQEEDDFAADNPAADASGGTMLAHTLYRMAVEPAILIRNQWHNLNN